MTSSGTSRTTNRGLPLLSMALDGASARPCPCVNATWLASQDGFGMLAVLSSLADTTTWVVAPSIS